MISEIIVAAAVGWIVSEATDISPWVAIKLVRWAAKHMYSGNAERAARRQEEWEALINDNESIPTKTAKLFFGLGLGCAGLYRVAHPVLASAGRAILDALPDVDTIAEGISSLVSMVVLAVIISLPDLWQLIVVGGVVALCGIGAGLAWLFTLPKATRKYRRAIFGLDEPTARVAPTADEAAITPNTNNPGC